MEETTEEVVEETSAEEEEVETEATEEVTSDEEETTSEEETVELYAGKYKSVDELEKAYITSNAEATRMAQQLSTRETTKKPQLTDEDKRVQDFIKNNNLMTTKQFQQQLQDNNEIQTLKNSGMTAKEEQVVRNLSRSQGSTANGIPYTQASMKEIHEDVFSSETRVVKKKVVGVKPRAGVKISNKLTREAIANMSKEEYAKRRPEILKAMAEGNL